MGLGGNSTLPLSVFRVAVIHFDHASFTLIFYSFMLVIMQYLLGGKSIVDIRFLVPPRRILSNV